MTKVFAAALAAIALAACSSLPQPEGPVAANAPALPAGTIALPQITYQVLKAGPAEGRHPSRRDVVTVNYEVALADGKIVDSSYARGEPATFPLDELILAWQIFVPLMRPGDEWRVVVPPEYAYGSADRGEIPPNSTLTFRMELLSIE